MTTEQAHERLEAIKRLLAKREKSAKEIAAIDAQIAELAGTQKERRPTCRKPLTRTNFNAAMGA